MMKHILLTTLLLALTAPAFADGAKPQGTTTLAPAPKAPVAKKTPADMDKLFADRCEAAGGGAMSGNDGKIHCVDAQGQDVDW